ncbi:hypothetical protein HYW11_02595 [Candidatus Peregrinibacteria bacterium]|nr:hypothetical protein [Candidatus Peregrinibacteria bacterium]
MVLFPIEFFETQKYFVDSLLPALETPEHLLIQMFQRLIETRVDLQKSLAALLRKDIEG